MRVSVVTVFAPRPEHPKFIDYLPLLAVQKISANKLGHDHLIITDRPMASDFDHVVVDLPQEVMPAMIAGVIAALDNADDHSHFVMVDADCLVNRKLNVAFSSDWDLGLTRRKNEVSPINNGAMYVHASGVSQSKEFFRRALSVCENHWGGDQEAISNAAAPVPDTEGIEDRDGLRIAFLAMKDYASVPPCLRKKSKAFMVHFKGAQKSIMLGYADKFL